MTSGEDGPTPAREVDALVVDTQDWHPEAGGEELERITDKGAEVS